MAMNPAKTLPADKLYLKNRARLIPDWEQLYMHMINEGKVTKEDFKKIIATANKFFGLITRSRTQSSLSARSADDCW